MKHAVVNISTTQVVSTAIMGATNPEQVAENMQAVEVLPMLTDDVMAMINAVSVEGIEVD